VGPDHPDLDRLKFLRAIKYDLRYHTHRPAMTVPRFCAFYGHKTRIPPDSHIFGCCSPRLPSRQGPPDPDPLKVFRATKYDLRNHSHCPAMNFPRFLRLQTKNKNSLDSHIFVCYSPCITRGPGPPGPRSPKILRDIKYDLRNHSHRPAMTFPHLLALYSQKIRIPPDSHILVC